MSTTKLLLTECQKTKKKFRASAYAFFFVVVQGKTMMDGSNPYNNELSHPCHNPSCFIHGVPEIRRVNSDREVKSFQPSNVSVFFGV